MDQGHNETEKLLVALEQKITRVYGEASKDMQKKADEYFAKLEGRDKKQRELYESGKITEQQYKQWRLAQIGRGERFVALRDDLAQRMTEANKVAMSYVNDATPGIYSLNHNYAAYTIEQVSGNVSFTLYDEQTVKRLIVEDPTLLPKRRVNAPKDLKWNKQRFTSEIVSGILQGESIGKLANRVQNLSDANRSGAIRNARTAVTSAQNAGRQESYNRAKEMGLPLRKRWIATKDGRTRHEHAMLDGQTVPLDEPFEIEGHKLMFPGDPTGLARLVWNCRCTMRTVEKEGIESEPRQIRVRDPETGRNVLIDEMTYQEWVAWKNREAVAANAEIDATAAKFFGLNSAKNLSSVVKRSTIKTPGGFECFPDGDMLKEYVQKVKPLKTYFDVAMHGTPSAVCFGTSTPNMSARVLASVIRHSEGYNGQKVRLLSCSTGKMDGADYCFAEDLANALGVAVKAPNNVLYISKSGALTVGDDGNGKIVEFKPNQRRRIK